MSLETEKGDAYLHRIAAFIRTNERSLAEAGVVRRRRVQHTTATDSTSLFNPLGWFGFDNTANRLTASPPKSLVVAMDIHHLFYILMRLEALGIDVGTLDVQVDTPSRPVSYINVLSNPDKSDTLSLASFRSSLSAVSGLSLGGNWWGRQEPLSVDAELKYIYSSFTKLPALLVKAPGSKIIAELVNDPPNHNALPLDAFKNLQSLECVDIDPRMLLGWDRLAESLRSLKVRKSGLEDISDIFIGAVVDDQARREGSTSRKRRRRISRRFSAETAFYTTRLPDTVLEGLDEENSNVDSSNSGSSSPPPIVQLSPLKWAFLKHLSLADNSLTFFPAEPLGYLVSLTHLDLSSNLLVSVPSGLGTLYNLVSLNLSDNMIDSVLGIYQNLGQVLYLNLSHNRLESICGLERLGALERVDLRNNLIDESSEIGRLSTLPNIAEVWMEGNPFIELEEGYRITCFDYFWKERKIVLLDGTPPGFYEKRSLTVAPPEQMSSSRPLSTTYSPPVVAIGSNHIPLESDSLPSVTPHDKYSSPPTSGNPSPPVGAISVGGKVRRKKAKRIVELDEDYSDSNSMTVSHRRNQSEGPVIKPKLKHKVKETERESPLPRPTKKWGQLGAFEVDGINPKLSDNGMVADHTSMNEDVVNFNSNSTSGAEVQSRSPLRTRHSRYQTEFTPSNSLPASDARLSPKSESTSHETYTPISTRRDSQGSATFSSKSDLRRMRVSASVYEPPTAGKFTGTVDEIRDGADAYRRRIEALKKDMGDGWLKVYSQSQMKYP